MAGIKSTSKFTWRIEEFSKLAVKKKYSEIFTADGCKWRLLIFPKGNNTNYLSIYLDVPDSTTLPYGWSRDTEFSLAVVNQSNNDLTVKKETRVVFNSQINDWGFTSFIELSKINDPCQKYIVNDTLIVEAEVVVRSAVHYSAPDPKQVQRELPPSLPVVDEQRILAKEPFPEPTQPSRGVQAMPKSLLAELSSLTRIDEISNEEPKPGYIFQQQNEALQGFFNMSLEAIQQANALPNIEGIVLKLVQNTNNLHQKKILEHIASGLKEFQEILPSAKATVETTQARRTSLTKEATYLNSTIAQRKKKLSSLEDEFSRVSEEEEKIQAEIQKLVTKKEELSIHKKSISSQREKAKAEASIDLEDWRRLEREIKEADDEWLEAKEKLALADTRWKLFKEDLDLGKANVP